MLPPELLVVHGAVGGLAWRGAVSLRAGACAGAGVGGHAAITSFLRGHFALFEHLLLVVFVHDAHLLVRVGGGAHARAVDLGLVALLVEALRHARRALTCLHLLHAARVAILLGLRLAHVASVVHRHSLAVRVILLSGVFELNLVAHILIEVHVSSGDARASLEKLLSFKMLLEGRTRVALL